MTPYFGLAACLVALALPAAAVADTASTTRSYPSRILDAGWDGDNHFVTGVVVTKRTPAAFRCVQARTVVVKYLNTGRVVGTARTLSSGRRAGSFRVALGRFAPVGSYRVTVRRKKVGSTLCGQASVTIRQPHPQFD